MKKLLFSILFFGLMIGVKAQYHPILGDSGKWNLYSVYSNQGWPQNGMPQNIESTFSFEITQHDTIINSIHYRKSNTNQYFREDSANKKIYILDTIEKLLYDFSLQASDSFFIRNSDFAGWFHVKRIDSVLTLLGLRKRIVVNINHSNQGITSCDLEWIESIGSTFGLDYRSDMQHYFIPDASTSTLLCSWQNNQQVYQNSNFTQCYINNVGIDNIKSQNTISIFPNPALSSFTIQKSSTENLQFQLYNLFGQNVLSENLVDESTMLNRNQLSNGIYFYKITNSKAEIKSNGKIVFE